MEDGANTRIDFIGFPARCIDFRCFVFDTHGCDSTKDAQGSISPCSQLRTSDHKSQGHFAVINKEEAIQRTINNDNLRGWQPAD